MGRKRRAAVRLQVRPVELAHPSPRGRVVDLPERRHEALRARLVEGEVRMERNFALDKQEVAAGFVLTCQAHPVTERVVLSFDER